MITEYKIISEVGIPAFEEKVNEAIKEGWQPYGEFAIDGFMLIQAMVKSFVPNPFTSGSLIAVK